MITTKTPFRISFFGGGTDVPEYFMEHGGAVLSTSIDKYCYVTIRRLPAFFDYSTELAYSVIEKVNDISQIKHPAIREALKMTDTSQIRLAYEADLPARSGLGTSSSFAVGMLNAIYAFKGQFADKKRLSDEAIYLERILCGEAGGWQDQIAAAYGGFNRISFNSDGYNVSPVLISNERKAALESNLMLFFTGFTHSSIAIHEKSRELIKENEVYLNEMKMLVDAAEKVLLDASSDIDEFGRMLDYTWELKKKTNSMITTEKIDIHYRDGIRAGALGGKLLGAGGGGYLLFYVPREKRESVKKALENLLYVPFRFENSGASVLFYSPD